MSIGPKMNPKVLSDLARDADRYRAIRAAIKEDGITVKWKSYPDENDPSDWYWVWAQSERDLDDMADELVEKK